MMPYRAGAPVVAPVVLGDAFPRKNVGVLTALVVAVAVAVVVVPLLLVLGIARGMAPFRAGGAGMFVLLALSVAVAAVTGVAGAGAVRGRHRWVTALAALPVLPAVVGALFGALGMRRVFAAIEAVPRDTDLAMRLASLGLAEADVLPAYGALIGAVACGAAACALLASAASVDRTQNQAPAGAAWAAPAAFGGLAFIVAIAVRLALHAGYVTMLLAVPSLLVLTGLACAAAVNAPLVRHWREPRETNAWVAALFAAALLAAGGLFLLELGAALLDEAKLLALIYGPAVDPLQRAALLANVADHQGSLRDLGVVDGVLAFLILSTPALAGLARASDGRLRAPRGAPIAMALGGVVLGLGALFAFRSWEFGRIESRAGALAEGPEGLDLPRVPVTERLVAPEQGAATLRIDAHGKAALDTLLPALANSSVLVVEADRRAHWEDVVAAIRDARTKEALASTRIVELRVTLLDKADRTQLGPYGPLLGNEISALRVSLAPAPRNAYDFGDDLSDLHGATPLGARKGPNGESGEVARIQPRPGEVMDGIAAAIARRPRSASYGDDLALLPPQGSW